MTKLRALVAVLFGLFLLCFAPAAFAGYVPPEMTGHVTDPAGRLSNEMVDKLNAKLESYRLRTGNEIAVFFPATLGDYSIDDVGFDTASAWKLGAGKNDNGVLLVIAPVERKVRIEVGKGVEGALTDLQSNDIIQAMKPRLKRGEWGLAADEATDQIMSVLDGGGAKSAPAGGRSHPATTGDIIVTLIVLLIVFGVPILMVIAIASAIGRAFTSNGRSAYRGWSSGSSWSNDSSWSSGGGSSWSSGGSSFGSDFSGGGGSFGGGGSSDSF